MFTKAFATFSIHFFPAMDVCYSTQKPGCGSGACTLVCGLGILGKRGCVWVEGYYELKNGVESDSWKIKNLGEMSFRVVRGDLFLVMLTSVYASTSQ